MTVFFISLLGFYLLGISSFYTSVIVFTFITLYIWIKRKDLILDSLYSGILLTIVSIFAFLIIEMITPGWVQATWYMENLTGIVILTAPLEDLVWVFLTGTFIGPLYEFWNKGKVEQK